jgi:hypothetical protein
MVVVELGCSVEGNRLLSLDWRCKGRGDGESAYEDLASHLVCLPKIDTLLMGDEGSMTKPFRWANL